MRLGIILSLLCVSLLWHPLRLAAQVDVPVSGVQGKHRWLLKSIKLKVEDTHREGRKAL